MERNRALSIISKCIALSQNNDNLAEAKTAALKAQELAYKHNINLDDIKPENKRIVYSVITDWGKTMLWHKKLASIIAPNFRCFYYIQFREGRSSIVFVGLEDDVELAKQIFKYTLDKIQAGVEDYKKTMPTWSTGQGKVVQDFIYGFLDGLNNSFQSQANENSLLPALAPDDAVVKEFEKLNIKWTAHTIKDNGNEEAQSAGKRLGESQ